MKKAGLILSTVVVIMIIISCGSKSSNEESTINDSFTTNEPPAAIDSSTTSEASIPNEVRIGNQVWKTKNLNVDKFRNGDIIPEAKNFEEWELACKKGKPAWCYYNFDSTNGEKYGKLYNIFAVRDPRILAPAGFRIPNDNDWITLANFFGGEEVAGKKMKSKSGWANNGNGTNFLGWSGLPGGTINEKFIGGGKSGSWWGFQHERLADSDSYSLSSESNSLYHSPTFNDLLGKSVRCIK